MNPPTKDDRYNDIRENAEAILKAWNEIRNWVPKVGGNMDFDLSLLETTTSSRDTSPPTAVWGLQPQRSCTTTWTIASIFILIGLFLLVGCDWGTSPAPLPSLEEQNMFNPRIILKGTEITINGKPIKHGATLEEWIQVVGEKPRTSKMGGVYIWDNLGFRVYDLHNDNGTYEEGKIGAITIELNRVPIPPYWDNDENDKPGINIHSRSLFHGYLELDGVQIRADSTIRNVNTELKKIGKIRPFYISWRSSVGDTVAIDANIRVSIILNTDNRRYNGVVYSIGLERSNLTQSPMTPRNISTEDQQLPEERKSP
jgi:hypothetical protein